MNNKESDWNDERPKQLKILKQPYKREFEVGCYYARYRGFAGRKSYFKILEHEPFGDEYLVIEWNMFLNHPWERWARPINLRGAKKVKPTLDIIFKIGG